MADLARFFVAALPAALYRLRWLTVVCGAAFILVAGAYALWIGTSSEALRSVASEAAVRQYVEKDFIGYYSENPAASFAGPSGPTMPGSARRRWPWASPASGYP
ncbi:hypothetical protein AHiyo4_14050 [Arthrobacter sp. Hiyo4]|nr:hypothetical protein AHiyo4_14050 [Arthrobacter sp. Hiyo4]